MGWHTVVVIDHDTWREARKRKNRKQFFRDLDNAVTGMARRRRITMFGSVLGRFHNSDDRLREIRRIAES